MTLSLAPRSTPLVMGVVNVTPDSFSDGGQWFEPEAAVAHGRELLEQGADILDVGGESTRPGAERPSLEEELRRVLPVVRELADLSAVVSVDTMRAEVAARAVEAGAAVINDVSGGLADPEMAAVAASAGVPFIAMHWRGHSRDMQDKAVYADVAAEVCAELSVRVEELQTQGIARDNLVLDPGFGFSKLARHNWSLLRHLDQLVGLGLPVLVGTSRKTFLGRLGVPEGGHPRPPLDRDAATAATSLYAAQAGVWCVRVHDVPSTLDALRVAAAVSEAP
jgi:dihydropteroate synthase